MQGPWRHIRSTARDLARYISISTEMPGPWRRQTTETNGTPREDFNLNRDARPLATANEQGRPRAQGTFQSQPRCQAPGDANTTPVPDILFDGFNLNRD